MNGKEYLSAFSAYHLKTDDYYDALQQTEVATLEQAWDSVRGNEQLDSMLSGLYYQDAFEDDQASSPEDIREITEAVRKLQSTSKVYRQIGKHAIDSLGLGRSRSFGLSDFVAEWMTADEVISRVEQDRATLSGLAKLHSSSVLAMAVLFLESKRFKDKAAPAVKEALGHNRRELYTSLETYNRVINVERSYYNGRKTEADKKAFPLLGLEVSVYQGPATSLPPRWLTDSGQWHEALHSMCASLTEMDTYIALQEWVIDRKLPLVPVIAPRSIEGGNQHRPKGDTKNYRADLLLLDLTKNDIIPIQVKNRITDAQAEEYFDGMAFVNPKSLGLKTYGHKPVTRASGVISTGDTVVTSHGQILSAWLNLQSSKAPKKANKLAFAQMLEPAFRTFDEILTVSRRFNEVQVVIPEQADEQEDAINLQQSRTSISA